MRRDQVRPTGNAAACQQPLIERTFDAARTAAEHLAEFAPALNRDRTEYAVASVLLEEAWVSAR